MEFSQLPVQGTLSSAMLLQTLSIIIPLRARVNNLCGFHVPFGQPVSELTNEASICDIISNNSNKIFFEEKREKM